MRGPVAQLEDLLAIIERTELGARAREHGVKLWALDCGRRAVAANIEMMATQAPILRRAVDVAGRWLRDPAAYDHELTTLASQVAHVQQQLADRATQASSRRLALRRAWQASIAIGEAMTFCTTGIGTPTEVAAAAREAFPDPEHEATAQLRRLLLSTRLLPNGHDLLVRLDYADAQGLPEDAATRTWLETQRAQLMMDDEQCRFAVTIRCFDLVFLAELDQRSR